MKGIILAGGSATRLYPVTVAVCKQLLPVYDKPMIYYPLSILMLAGIKEILIISTPDDLQKFANVLGDGANLGIKLSYKKQDVPRGLADAFIIGKDFAGDGNVCLILGDNIFYGESITTLLKSAVNHVENNGGGMVFGYIVNDPERYGVVEFDKKGSVTSIEEKPQKPKSNYAVTGLYFYDNKVFDIAGHLVPSPRGELEITDINRAYLEMKQLKVEILGRGYAWLDTGTYQSLLEAGNFIETIEERQGLKIACLEEIALRLGYIKKEQILEQAKRMHNCGYGKYLIKLYDEFSRRDK